MRGPDFKVSDLAQKPKNRFLRGKKHTRIFIDDLIKKRHLPQCKFLQSL